MVSKGASIARLAVYKNVLLRLRSMGTRRVFSKTLAEAAGVTAAQVRKDFSAFGIAGNRRGGYQVDQLLGQIAGVLCKDRPHRLIVVGAGRIGQALMHYRGFEASGIRIAAAFDTDPDRFDRNGPIPVLPLQQLPQFVAENGIGLAILAVPDVAAQHVAELLASAGIKGILNFAPIRLRVGPGTVVNNVNLEVEIENLAYFAAQAARDTAT